MLRAQKEAPLQQIIVIYNSKSKNQILHSIFKKKMNQSYTTEKVVKFTFFGYND
jgi:hypothetical protein